MTVKMEWSPSESKEEGHRMRVKELIGGQIGLAHGCRCVEGSAHNPDLTEEEVLSGP